MYLLIRLMHLTTHGVIARLRLAHVLPRFARSDCSYLWIILFLAGLFWILGCLVGLIFSRLQ
jgi:hypothetical protein